MSDGSEKRQFPRVRIPMLVQYRTSPLEEFKTDYASDISEGGIFLSETNPPVPTGATLFMQFVTRDGMHMVSLEATVVRRTTEGGQGMRFVKLDNADLAVLKDLVAKVLTQNGGQQA
jgi:c-di-GMP-binding flagellar brake protein YcgR